MRCRGPRAALAVLALLVLALGVQVGVTPAFADDAPPPPEPSTSLPETSPPDTTAPDTAPDTAPEPVPADGQAAAPDAPVAQVTPVVTVTPSTDLVHLQSVTVHGSGFTPNVAVGFAECNNTDSGDADDCDVGHSGYATTDSFGAFTAPFVVRRLLHTPNGDVDCATAPATCNVGAAKISDYAEHAGATLTFDPATPLPPPPTLLAGPLSNLRDGDSVALFGGGFVPNGQVAVVQCSQPTPSTCQLVSSITADVSGGFIALVPVHRVIATPPFGATDCADAPGTCQLRAVSLADYDFEAHVLLDFDPAGPLPTAALAVSPDTDLVHFQKVQVRGSGFPSGSGAQLTQCRSDATSSADCSSGSAFVGTGTGTFTTTVRVRRVLHLQGGDFDCASAPGVCSLVASAYGVPPVVVTHALDFDASAPLPPAPSITVTPDAGLVQGQSVMVTGANFAPQSSVGIGQCLGDALDPQYGPSCSFGGVGTQTDATGAFSQQVTLRRGVLDFTGSFPPSIVDCAESPGRCSIVAYSFDGDDRAGQAIDFDPSVPVPVPDTTVSPRLGLADRALVQVHSSGFSAHERVLVSQCVAGTPSYGTSCSNSGSPTVVLADANGVVDTELRVHRQITPSDGVVIILADGTVNCADAVGACVMRVQSIDDPLVVGDVELGFDPTAVAPPPTLTITPNGPYTDGQQVEVHGSGYTPNAVLGLAQCRAGEEPNGRTCDTGLFDEFRAEADGTFTRTVTLHTDSQNAHGPLDCSAADSCVMFAANRADYGAERASVPIEWAPTVEVAGSSQTRALAFTGAGGAAMPTAIVGVVLVLLGGALLVLSVACRRTARN